jgi:hypothetical protein
MLVPALLATCLLGAAACGGSSTSSSTTTTTALATTVETTVTTTQVHLTPAVAAAYRGKLEAYASCMRAHGVDVAPPKNGPNGVPQLSAPSGASHQQVIAALRMCRVQVIAALEAHHSLHVGP